MNVPLVPGADCPVMASAVSGEAPRFTKIALHGLATKSPRKATSPWSFTCTSARSTVSRNVLPAGDAAPFSAIATGAPPANPR